MVRSHAAAGASPKGALNSWKSSFLAQLSDDAIDTMVEHPMGQCCSSISTALQLRVGVSDTAFPHRSDGCNFLVLSQWMEPTNTDQSIAWARETYAEMERRFRSLWCVTSSRDEAAQPGGCGVCVSS
jgi:hypothetical protein